jgi:hypothetical protein
MFALFGLWRHLEFRGFWTVALFGSPRRYVCVASPSGGIGRRSRLKICRAPALASSSLALGISLSGKTVWALQLGAPFLPNKCRIGRFARIGPEAEAGKN